MNETEEDYNGRDEDIGRRRFSFENLNRIVAILFVLAIYLFIFLKILVLE